MDKLKAGDKVVVKYEPHNRHEQSWVSVHTVTRVGRKYFHLDMARDTEFRLDTMTERTAYSSRYKIYRSVKEWYSDVTLPAIYHHLMRNLTTNSCMWYSRKKGYTIEQYTWVCEILGIDYKEVLSQYDEDYKRLIDELYPDTFTGIRETNG